MCEPLLLESEIPEQEQQEVEKLKLKIDKLTEKINNINYEILERKKVKDILENEVKILKIKENASGEQPYEYKNFETRFDTFLRDFCLIAKMIFEKNEYIPYSYATNNSEFFYKLEKSVFESYIEQYAQTNIKAFLNYSVKLAMIKAEKNGKCTYNSGKLVVYYVSKPFVDLASGKEVSGEV